MGELVRSAALGLAAGGRSSVAFAVPVVVATRGRHDGPSRVLRAVARAAVLGELVADKLPTTPSRLGAPQLAGRLLAGAAGALALAVVGRCRPTVVATAPVVGALGAFVGSVVGASWREQAAASGVRALEPDLRAALVEDAVVLVTAAALTA